MHEKSMHEYSSFLTLTYDDKHVPSNGSLNERDVQLFLMRLRKYLQDTDIKIRYFYCGEYGEQNLRPHYHMLLFGFEFPDRKRVKQNKQGDDLYTSKKLDELWGKGYCWIGNVTRKSAEYVSRYILKKVGGDQALEHYQRIDQHGEIHQVVPEFVRMSLKPGIGATWFEKYGDQIFPRDEVIVDGKKTIPPRYYQSLRERSYQKEIKRIKAKRKASATKRAADNTPERLAQKAIVRQAKISRLRRD